MGVMMVRATAEQLHLKFAPLLHKWGETLAFIKVLCMRKGRLVRERKTLKT
jgi:hypothetical protein